MSKRILLIEDDITLANLTADCLVAKGFFVSICNNSNDAKDDLKNNFDIILLDINLPNSSGFELCAYIRTHINTPIIFMSARTSVSDKTYALDIGGDDYIEKPYSIDELVARINAILRRSPLTNIIYFDDIEIDLNSRTVKKAGKDIRLANKEFELLKYLVINKNKSVSKDALFINVWGEFSDASESSLSVHIRWLREKLENNPSNPKYLVTVHGYGYRMVIE